MGNRCGHNRDQLRFCDMAKRGKGGQPQLIGVVSAYLGEAGRKRNRLTTWQTMNESGRRRRTEILEAMVSTAQFLFANDYQVDSRRCARRVEDFHQAPDAELIARQISAQPGWRHTANISEARVRKVIKEFHQCGYITLSHQQRRQRVTGEWEASPKVITFTKKFFLELGGKKLWAKVARTCSDKAKALADKFRHDTKQLAKYFRLEKIFSPRQARRRSHLKPPQSAPVTA